MHRRSLPTWLSAAVIIMVALFVTIATVFYQRAGSALCRGLLGGGFPIPMVCDASGESPLSSVGRIDWADHDSINPIGSLLDLLFYALILWDARNVLLRPAVRQL